MADEEKRPIIIRRKVVKGGGHHGGAWKVAYADFVTAMMAFFLLMWLLNATTEEQRKGLADYFSPTIAVHRTSGGGAGPFAGSSVTSEEIKPLDGKGASDENPTDARKARGDSGADQTAAEDAALQGVADALVARMGESDIADAMAQHVRMRRTDEGLVIEVAELPGSPLFNGSGAEPTARFLALMTMIGEVIGGVGNAVAVDNHMNANTITRPGEPEFQLTSARALISQAILADAGVLPVRFARVAGEADRAPSYEDPLDIRNRRTEVILLTTAG
ncbi:MAG: flagellar motor protein MotB [Pseudomonadota bacterium]